MKSLFLTSLVLLSLTGFAQAQSIVQMGNLKCGVVAFDAAEEQNPQVEFKSFSFVEEPTPVGTKVLVGTSGSLTVSIMPVNAENVAIAVQDSGAGSYSSFTMTLKPEMGPGFSTFKSGATGSIVTVSCLTDGPLFE